MTNPSGPTFTRHNWPQFQSALTDRARAGPEIDGERRVGRARGSVWTTKQERPNQGNTLNLCRSGAGGRQKLQRPTGREPA